MYIRAVQRCEIWIRNIYFVFILILVFGNGICIVLISVIRLVFELVLVVVLVLVMVMVNVNVASTSFPLYNFISVFLDRSLIKHPGDASHLQWRL